MILDTESKATPVPESDGAFVQLQSTHLSAFLATHNCKPVAVVKGPEVTSLGNPVAKWRFMSTENLKDIAIRWSHPVKDAADWDDLNKAELEGKTFTAAEVKDILINSTTGFSDNLRHFLSDAKRESR